MATKTNTARINQIFDDLDRYRNFCREYGYRFNEAELYNPRSNVYKQFQRFLTNKPVKDQWEVDYIKYREQEAFRDRG